MLDLVIRGGLVVTPEEVGERDIGVQEGKIVAIAAPGYLPTEAAAIGGEVEVVVRDRPYRAEQVKLPFYRRPRAE